MVDIRIVQNFAFPELSVPLSWNLLPNGTLDTSHDIETAILVAVGTDSLAQPTDVLPDPHSSDRKGWWGDVDAAEIWGGWPIGWRGWLLRRTKITDAGAKQGATVTIVNDYLNECLTPFVTNKIISSFDITVQRNSTNRQRIDAFVSVYRANNKIDIKFSVFFNVTSPPQIITDDGFYVITI